MKFTDIINNPHFATIAALARVPMRSPSWRRRHPTVPFWALFERFDAVTNPLDKQAALEAFTELMVGISSADPRLAMAAEGMDWFIETLDGPDAVTTFAMLKAFMTAPDVFYTPTELARVTGGESTWRKRAMEGQVPGSIMKGKQWLLPRGVLVKLGFLTEDQAAQLQAFEYKEDDEAPS